MNKEDIEKAMDKIMLTKKLSKDVYEISKVAIKIVEYFNPDETVWDSKMYEQKHVVIELLNQLNQNKDEKISRK